MTMKLFHPFQLVIEQAWDEGHTPQVVAATTAVRGLPAVIAAQHEGTVMLDLIPTYPLNPYFDAEGMGVDLAFQGSVVRCTVPWNAIGWVRDLETGLGYMRLVSAKLNAEPEKLRPGLRAIKGGKGDSEPN